MIFTAVHNKAEPRRGGGVVSSKKSREGEKTVGKELNAKPHTVTSIAV